jgi:hypothetical protein
MNRHTLDTGKVDPKDLHELVTEIRNGLHELGVAVEHHAHVHEHLDKVSAQLQHPEPDHHAIGDALHAVRVALDNSGATLMAGRIAAMLRPYVPGA